MSEEKTIPSEEKTIPPKKSPTILDLAEYTLGDIETIMEDTRKIIVDSYEIKFTLAYIKTLGDRLEQFDPSSIFMEMGTTIAQCSLIEARLDAALHSLRALEKFLKYDLFHQLCITNYYDDAAKKEVPMTMWSHWDDIGKNDISRETAFEIEAGKWFPRHSYWAIRLNRRYVEDRKTEINGVRYAIEHLFKAEERRQRYEEYREQRLSPRY